MHHVIYLIGKHVTIQTHRKSPMMISKSFSLLNLDYFHLKDFLKYSCELYLKQPLTPPQWKTIVAYCTLNHRLAIEIGRWTTIPISRYNKLMSFWFLSCSYKRGTFCVGMSPIKPHLGHVSIITWKFNSREPWVFLLVGPSSCMALASISERLPHSATLGY
jgi:hypothetical protein